VGGVAEEVGLHQDFRGVARAILGQPEAGEETGAEGGQVVGR
jgi:hypothetical protein